MVSLDSLIGFYSSFGYLSVFGVLILCGFGLPIPEDISIIAGGIISGLGYTNVHIMGVVAFFGVLIGDTIIYNIGRFFGVRIFNHRIGRQLQEKGWYDRIIRSFNENGKMVLFVARFLPGLRTPIFLTAGITKFVGLPTFILIDGFAALISVPLWNYLGYYGASNRELMIHWIRNTKLAFVVILVVAVVVYIALKLIRKKVIDSKIIPGE